MDTAITYTGYLAKLNLVLIILCWNVLLVVPDKFLPFGLDFLRLLIHSMGYTLGLSICLVFISLN